MVRRYNTLQISKAALCLAGGLICLWLAWLFFRYLPPFVAYNFGFRWSPVMANSLAAVCLIGVAVSGYRTWKAQGGLRGYHESSFYHDLGADSGGAFFTDYYAHRVTAPAHLLSQTFLGGPLLLLKVRTLLASLIPATAGLESRLQDALNRLRKANKWQPLSDYPDIKTEVLYLAQMGLIDFSAFKGEPRIKCH